METYLFYGTVLPERAQLSLQFELGFSHLGSGTPGTARVSIVLNQLAVWIETEREWDIHDLRNVVKTIVQNNLAILAYVKGYAYDLEITRILNPARGVDYVFGIEVPCVAERKNAADLPAELHVLRLKTTGTEGVFITRCLNDLASAMKHADDTGFYCYRAIESLKQHCAARHGLAEVKDNQQWAKFREISGIDEKTIFVVRDAARPLRHGGIATISSAERAKLFMITWDIVDAYLKAE